jgi:hypothetical protein
MKKVLLIDTKHEQCAFDASTPALEAEAFLAGFRFLKDAESYGDLEEYARDGVVLMDRKTVVDALAKKCAERMLTEGPAAMHKLTSLFRAALLGTNTPACDDELDKQYATLFGAEIVVVDSKKDCEQAALYAKALAGNAKAARALMTARRDYEYETWMLKSVAA